MKPAYVAISEVAVSMNGVDDLERAFGDRIRLVEGAAGFLDIEVLRDRRRTGRYLMVTRWRSKADFVAYMRSEDHKLSHSRIRKGPEGPQPADFRDYDIVEV